MKKITAKAPVPALPAERLTWFNLSALSVPEDWRQKALALQLRRSRAAGSK